MTKQRIHQGNLITLIKQRVELPNEQHTYYDIVEHPGGSVMAAINEQLEICFITQARPAVDATIWELPAGCLEPGEPVLATAQRELAEETGLVAEDWYELGSLVTTPGFCNEVLHLFAASDLSKTATNFDAEEQIESHWLSVADAERKIATGVIRDAKTIALLYRLRLHPHWADILW